MRQRLILSLWCLVFACTSLAFASRVVGPTASSGYFFTLQVSHPTIVLGAYNLSAERYPTSTEVLVRVQDRQGRAIDGVAVVFALEPDWAQSAVLAPFQAVTRGGVARATFSAPQATGRVRIAATVDNTTAWTAVIIQSYEERLEMD